MNGDRMDLEEMYFVEYSYASDKQIAATLFTYLNRKRSYLPPHLILEHSRMLEKLWSHSSIAVDHVGDRAMDAIQWICLFSKLLFYYYFPNDDIFNFQHAHFVFVFPN